MNKEICERCGRPEADDADWDNPEHPDGCSCSYCQSLCWGDCIDTRHTRLTLMQRRVAAITKWVNERNIEGKAYQRTGLREILSMPDNQLVFTDDSHMASVGDVLRSKNGYDVIVKKYKDDEGFYGKLVCKKGHSCENMHYCLNYGKDHTFIKKG